MIYTVCCTIYIKLSIFYRLLSSMYTLHPMICHLPSKLIYVLLSTFYQATWLAQLVERKSAVREVEGSSLRPDQHSGS